MRAAVATLKRASMGACIPPSARSGKCGRACRPIVSWPGRAVRQPGEELLRFGAAVTGEASVGKRPERALGLRKAPQAHQADGSVETRLRLEGAPWIAPQVVVPGGERAFGRAFIEVSAVGAPVGVGLGVRRPRRGRVVERGGDGRKDDRGAMSSASGP